MSGRGSDAAQCVCARGRAYVKRKTSGTERIVSITVNLPIISAASNSELYSPALSLSVDLPSPSPLLAISSHFLLIVDVSQLLLTLALSPSPQLSLSLAVVYRCWNVSRCLPPHLSVCLCMDGEHEIQQDSQQVSSGCMPAQQCECEITTVGVCVYL